MARDKVSGAKMTQDSKKAKDLGWGPEWRVSGAHLAFLCTFITPRLPNDHPHIEGVNWHQVLGKQPEVIVARLRVVSRAIDVCTDAAAIEKHFTVKELRKMLRDQDVKGISKLRKQELIDKVIQKRLLLQCTEEGLEIAKSYAAEPEAFLNDIWTESRMKAFFRRLLVALAEEIAIGTVIGTLLWNAAEKLLSPAELPPQPTPQTPEAQPAPEPPATATPGRHRPKLEWCYVPAGRFWMGEGSDKQREYLPAFHISKYLITNAEYEKFCRATGYETPYHWKQGVIPAGKKNHPVVHVSWRDAIAYCDWASRAIGKQIALPTEEQWEKAARGSDGRIYPWGNDWRENHCNSRESGNRGTTPVGAYSPRGDSPYGCADMAGNVWEWTASWYDDTRQQYHRTLRGGSWYDYPRGARAASRDYDPPAYRYYSAGFRVVVRRPPSR